jgi:hypothetical protein
MANIYHKTYEGFLNHFKDEEKVKMPLVKGAKAKSRKGFSENVKREIIIL